jgi:hypothetical protein
VGEGEDYECLLDAYEVITTLVVASEREDAVTRRLGRLGSQSELE